MYKKNGDFFSTAGGLEIGAKCWSLWTAKNWRLDRSGIECT